MTARLKGSRYVSHLVVGGLIVLAAALATERGEAHKAVTSKYTYNDDVFPILRDRCSRCHVAGGVAPMSLMTYDEAFPWGESIRAELIAAHMPPWNAEGGFGEFKHAHTLTPNELDVILTWVTGGNPRGSLDQKLPTVTLVNDWALGKPDLALPMPSEYAMPSEPMEETKEFTIATGTTEARWVRAVDLLPGTPAIVRSAVIYVKSPAAASSSNGEPAPDQVLARWVPGQDPEPLDGGAAFRLPAGAELGVRIHYKKTWSYEGKPMTDRSTVGVYFAQASTAQEVLALPLTSPALPAADAINRSLTFSQAIDSDLQVLALSPERVPANISLQVQAVLPNGSREPMIRLNTRADWARRYWFERPLTLPRGSKIEVVANLVDPDLMSAAFGSPAAQKTPGPSTLRLALNVIPANSKPAAP
ncbi:MAG: hypothetical protein HY047_07220 [Acidobacteria bacterium]|nr:hypothetical protein [Acidobacteriota bacterium]